MWSSPVDTRRCVVPQQEISSFSGCRCAHSIYLQLSNGGALHTYLGSSKEEKEAVLAVAMEHGVLVHRAVDLEHPDVLVLQYSRVQRFIVNFNVFWHQWHFRIHSGGRRSLCSGHRWRCFFWQSSAQGVHVDCHGGGTKKRRPDQARGMHPVAKCEMVSARKRHCCTHRSLFSKSKALLSARGLILNFPVFVKELSPPYFLEATCSPSTNHRIRLRCLSLCDTRCVFVFPSSVLYSSINDCDT